LFLREFGGWPLGSSAEIESITTEEKAGPDPSEAGIEHEGIKRCSQSSKTGGRQYRVVPDDVLEIGKIAGDVGTIVQLGEVLLVGGESPVLGAPTVAGASVAAKCCSTSAAPR